MQVYTSFRHMDASPALKEYTEEKIRRVVRKYIRDNFDAQVTFTVEKFRHRADVLLNYKGLSIKCEGESEDMYASVDVAMDKLERQVRRYKDKLRRHKPQDGRDRLFELSVIRAPLDFEDDDDLSGEFDPDELEAQIAAAPEEPPPGIRVVDPIPAPEAVEAAEEAEQAEEAEADEDDDSPAEAEAAESDSASAEYAEATPASMHVLKREVMTAHPMSVDDAVMQLDLEQRAFLVFTNAETAKINVIYRRADGNFGLIEPRAR